MTLRDEILARSDLSAQVAARNIDAIAAAMSVGRKSVQPRMVTARAIIAECPNGAAILDALEEAALTDTNVKWAMKFLALEAGIDIGNEATRGLIDYIAFTGKITQEQCTALKNLGLQPVTVTPLQVAEALYNPDGSMK